MSPRPAKRTGKRFLLAFAAPLAAAMAMAAAAAGFLVATPSGARWLAHQATSRIPGLSLRLEGGTLLSGLNLRDLAWLDGDREIRIARLDARWRIVPLPSPSIRIHHLHAAGLRAAFPPEPSAQPPLPWYEALSPARRTPIELPSVRLPVEIQLRDVSLDDAAFDFGGEPLVLRSLRFSAHLAGDALVLETLRLDHPFGQLEADGRLQFSAPHALSAAVRIRSDQLPAFGPLALHATLGNTLSQLDLDAHLESPVSIQFHSRLQPLDPSLPFRAALTWNDLRWPLDAPSATTSPTGRLDLAGSLDAYVAQLAADFATDRIPSATLLLHAEGDLFRLAVDPVAATLPGHVLDAAGHLSWTNGIAMRLEISDGPNRARLAGTYAEELDVSGELHVSRPSVLLPELVGRLDLTWKLAGPPASPALTLSAAAQDLAYSNLAAVARAAFELEIADLARAPSRAVLELDGLSSPESGQTIDALRADLAGNLSAHRLRIDARGGPLPLSLALHGSLDEESFAWTGILDRAEILPAGFAWSLASPVPMRWLPDALQFVLDPHLWRCGDAILDVPEPLVLGAAGAAHLRLADFDLAPFQSHLPRHLHPRGLLNARVQARWSKDEPPRGNLSAHVENAGLLLEFPDDLLDEDTPPLDFPFPELALDAAIDGLRAEARFRLSGPQQGAIRAHAAFELDADHRVGDWSGALELDAIQLAIARPFVPDLRALRGELDARLRFSGDLRRPQIRGALTLTNALVEPAALPVTIDGIHLRADVAGHRAALAGGFRSGDGQATVSGAAELGDDDAWQADLRLAGRRLRLAYGTLATLQADPNLRLRIAPGVLELSGTVAIPQADISIQHLPETAISPSPDAVVVLDSAPPAPPPPPAWNTSIDLDLSLGDRVALGGYGISGRLAGNLRLLQTNQTPPRAFGELRIEDGRYRAYGQRLQIRRGRFLFAGPIDRPDLSVEAIRDVSAHGVVAGLRVEDRKSTRLNSSHVASNSISRMPSSA